MSKLIISGQLVVEVVVTVDSDDLEGFDIDSLDPNETLHSQLDGEAYEAIETFMASPQDSDWLSEEVDIMEWRIVGRD